MGGSGPNEVRPLDNDNPTTGASIVLTTLDLDQTLSGVQSSVIVNAITFTANSSGVITWDFGYGSGQICQIFYTFMDSLGNTSNVGNCVVDFSPSIILSDDTFATTYSPGNTTGESVINNDSIFGCFGPLCFLSVVFSTSYPGFTLNSFDGTISIDSGVPEGTYTMFYSSNLNPSCFVPSAQVTLTVGPEIKLNIIGTYSDFNADGYTSVGDVVNYQYVIENASASNNINNVNVTSPTGLVVGSTIPVLNFGAIDNSTFTDKHIITQTEINNGITINKTATVSGTSSFGTSTRTSTTNNSLSISNGIKLNAFFDTNGNGVQNAGEINLNFGKFTYEINSDGIVHNITSSSGTHYLYESNPSTTYALSYVLDPAFTTYYALSTASYPSVTVAAGSGITTYNFPIVASTLFNDLSVNVIPSWWNAPRPGFTYNNTIKYTNHSNQTIPAGTVSFNCDSAISILSTSPTATTLTATNFTYDFVNLLPFESRYINVTMQVPVIPSVSLGQLVTNTVSIIPNVGDTTPLNNASSMTQTIVGAYDPNDKMESHGEEILHSGFSSNDYLMYTIRFENTGTANAVNVRINDVLDAQLDETSIKVIDASHSYFLDRVGTNLNFRFDAIDLPPSVADTSIGKGYVVFQVKPKPGYAIGDVIPNTANIYFDFNPAIVTNTFLTEFVSVLKVDSFLNNQTIIYPNPTSNVLNIESKTNILNIEIIDINGRSLLSKSQNSSSTSINVESLSKGVYFVKVSNEKGNFVQKFIKK